MAWCLGPACDAVLASVSRRVPNEIKSSRNSGVLPLCKLWHIIKFIITIGWPSAARRSHALCWRVFLQGLLILALDDEVWASSSFSRCPTGTS